jgi:hypothetical protein
MASDILFSDDEVTVIRDETLGGLEEEVFGPSFFILFQNFPLNSQILRPGHVKALEGWVAPYLRRPSGFMELYGMTDRSGSRDVNYTVGAHRVLAVQQGLKVFGIAPAKYDHAFTYSVGEDYFEHKHNQGDKEHFFEDGHKDGKLRVCVVALSPSLFNAPIRMFRLKEARETLAFCRAHKELSTK